MLKLELICNRSLMLLAGKVGDTMHMTIETSAESELGLIHVTIMGKFSLGEAKRTFLEILEAIVQNRSRRVLIDAREVTGKPDLIERFCYGEFVAQETLRFVREGKISLPLSFAYVLKRPVLDPLKFGETVARNRGMNVKTFENEEDALIWLQTPSSSSL